MILMANGTNNRVPARAFCLITGEKEAHRDRLHARGIHVRDWEVPGLVCNLTAQFLGNKSMPCPPDPLFTGHLLHFPKLPCAGSSPAAATVLG